MSRLRTRTRSLWRSLLAAALVALGAGAVTLAPSNAQACGGFFCSLNQPVEQAGEEILFSVDGTQVTAHISIKYQGPSEKFSWVLPMPNVPEFGVGTEALFAALRQQTDPRFEIEWQNTADCNYTNGCYCELDAAAGPRDDGGGQNTGSVDVVAEGSVGPFEYKVVDSDDSQALFTWLNDNGYDQPPTAKPIIKRYTDQGFVFVALRLQKDADTGEIQPIVLEYESPTMACVPLRLTSIAATDDMPITAWIVSEARAVPMNFFHVVLNASAYDWLNCAQPVDSGGSFWCGFGGNNADCRQSYIDLVTQATDAVNGHGFVTEYAGTTSIMDDALYTQGRFDLDKLRTITDPELYLSELLSQGFPRTPLMQEIIRNYIPKPDESTLPDECKDDNAFYNWNMQYCLTFMPADWTFEPGLFTDDLENRIVQPLVDAQGIFDAHGYMTRLFSTASPDEMDRDPLFSFNPNLPDVSNVHRVTATATCKPGTTNDVAWVDLTFQDGSSRRVAGNFEQCGGYEPTADSGTSSRPALARIQVMNESGAPTEVAFDEEEIQAWDDELELRFGNPNMAGVTQNPDANVTDNTGTFGQAPGTAGLGGGGDCGCTSVQSGNDLPYGGAIAGLLGLVGIMLWRRRT